MTVWPVVPDPLAGRFGEDQVFIDVDTIEPGVDFAEISSGLRRSAREPCQSSGLTGLARRNALFIRHESFRRDSQKPV